MVALSSSCDARARPRVALAAAALSAVAALNASAADGFVDSVGVNTHVTYTDTVYARNFSLFAAALADVGIRHVRDSCWAGLHNVNALAGVDVLCIPEVTTSTRKLDFSQLEAQLTVANNITRLVALEG